MTSQVPIELSESADIPTLVARWIEEKSGDGSAAVNKEKAWHSHAHGQLFCIAGGLVHVRTHHGSWLLPPQRAGWIPPGEPHSVSVTGVTRGWNMYIAPHASLHLPQKPCVLGVTELTWPLVRRVASWSGPLTSTRLALQPDQSRVVEVLLDEIRRAPHEPLHLPMPTDQRLLRIARGIIEQPDDARTLAQWAAHAGLSPRTLSRLFLTDVHMSFAQWRQQARLVQALELLASGQSVAQIADALGYATPSNFIAMFRRSFGKSPGRYFSAG
jgi:AraC-like DNA-binding protein